MTEYRITVTVTDDPSEPFGSAEEVAAYLADDLAFYANKGRRLIVRFPGVGFELAGDPAIEVEEVRR